MDIYTFSGDISDYFVEHVWITAVGKPIRYVLLTTDDELERISCLLDRRWFLLWLFLLL